MIRSATKLFPCDCMGEGIVVTVEEDDDFFNCEGTLFIGMAFWELQAKMDDHGRLHMSRWERVKYAWRILRGHSPWTDMVWMKAKIAQNLANHILYLISRSKKKVDESKMLVPPVSPTLSTEEAIELEKEEAELDLTNRVMSGIKETGGEKND